MTITQKQGASAFANETGTYPFSFTFSIPSSIVGHILGCKKSHKTEFSETLVLLQLFMLNSLGWLVYVCASFLREGNTQFIMHKLIFLRSFRMPYTSSQRFFLVSTYWIGIPRNLRIPFEQLS